MKTGLKDRNGKEIMVGDKVRFKYMGWYYTEVVEDMHNGYYYPFNPNIRMESGFYVQPSDCEIVK
jgi:hypothetical protein